MKIKGNLTLGKNSEIRNLCLEKASSAIPFLSSEISRLYFNTTSKKIQLNTGISIESIATLSDLSSEATLRLNSDSQLQTNISQVNSLLSAEISNRQSAINNVMNYVDSKISGLSWELPVKKIVVNNSDIIIANFNNSDRFFNSTNRKIYTLQNSSLVETETLVPGCAFYNFEDNIGYVINSSLNIVPFNGAQVLVAGFGLMKSGNTFFINSTGNTLEISEDSIDISSTILTKINDSYNNISSTASALSTITSNISAHDTRFTNASQSVKQTFFEYVSLAPSTTHTIIHNIGRKYVTVTVIDTDTDEVMFPLSIHYVDQNSLEITFSSSRNCAVVCCGIKSSFSI